MDARHADSVSDAPTDAPWFPSGDAGAGQFCGSHADCSDTLVCIGETSGTVCDLCARDHQPEPCACGEPGGPPFALVPCDDTADCEDLDCGANCDDCPTPCPSCIHGWCVYPTSTEVECWCTGCG